MVRNLYLQLNQVHVPCKSTKSDFGKKEEFNLKLLQYNMFPGQGVDKKAHRFQGLDGFLAHLDASRLEHLNAAQVLNDTQTLCQV